MSVQIMGVNKKYDCFDCQKNTFSVAQVCPRGREAAAVAAMLKLDEATVVLFDGWRACRRIESQANTV